MNDDLNIQEKIKTTYTKKNLIENIANECGKSKNTVRDIYNALEENIATLLSSADINTDISVRLFEGISIDSSFILEKSKLNNLTGEVITTKSKIKPKANITRYYCDKLTSHNRQK